MKHTVKTRILCLVLAGVLLIGLTACQPAGDDRLSSGSKPTDGSIDTTPKQTEPSGTAGTKPTDSKPTQPEGSEPETTVPEQSEPESTTAPTQPAPTEPKPTQPAPTQPKPTNPKPTQPKPTQPKPTEPKPTEPAPTEAWEAPDEKEVAAAVIKYINIYRQQEGTPAAQDGCVRFTEYAQRRSQQLVTNYAHDLNDIRALGKEMQYGTFCYDLLRDEDGNLIRDPETGNAIQDPDPEHGWWQTPGTEAIGRGGYSKYDTAEDVGRSYASGFFQSKGHWRYVGGAKYTYIAVGVTIDSSCNECYVCICVAEEDPG